MQIVTHTLALNLVLGSTNEQFLIPSYQRRYSWQDKQLFELIDDISMIDGNDNHLLGSIVCLTGNHRAGVNPLELVDGQQRLTTITILLECLKERFAAESHAEHVQELDRLLTARPYSGPALPKIALDTMDAEEFSYLVKNPQIDPDKPFLNERLQRAFENARGWIEDQETDVLLAFKYRLLHQALVIRLDVGNARDAFKLFETINNRGLRLSPTDLIKNFLLGNAARFGEAALAAAKQSWGQVVKYLDSTDTDAFFRYYLMAKTHSRLRKADIVSEFQAHFMDQIVEAAKLPDRDWYAYEEFEEEEDASLDADEMAAAQGLDEAEISSRRTRQVSFEQFLKNLVTSARVFGELVNHNTDDAVIDRHLRNLRMIKATQAYGFLMHLQTGGTDRKTFIDILRRTENFILRRHVCRERSNDTETLFANLCSIDPENPLEVVKDSYRDFSPSDEKFEEEFAATEFAPNTMDRARYCLERLELAKHGAHAELTVLGTELCAC
ncbi:DUF262 domain-containing protein [Rhizobium gallicum]|uniref:DUF262 domain-containing protein n=1 Tax=Rhizobium gallicum TaxID=56730 RepID=UPI001EF8B0CC|nr:DUF262 domain-containing protein [Rhizobium gallicum]ULJ74196.1 DUF262 domain-containing protein [Rhizobium gallicum]